VRHPAVKAKTAQRKNKTFNLLISDRKSLKSLAPHGKTSEKADRFRIPDGYAQQMNKVFLEMTQAEYP